MPTAATSCAASIATKRDRVGPRPAAGADRGGLPSPPLTAQPPSRSSPAFRAATVIWPCSWLPRFLKVSAMFAIVRTGGKQYRVAAGDKIAVEKIDGAAGDTVSLDDVLLASEG